MTAVLASVGVLVGGCCAVFPWFGDAGRRAATLRKRLPAAVPAMPAMELRAVRWYRRAGFAATGFFALVAAFVPLSHDAARANIVGMVLGLAVGTLAILLADALRHLAARRRARTAAALRHVTLSDYLPLGFCAALLALPVLSGVGGVVAGLPVSAALVDIVAPAVAAGIALWFVRQPERVDSAAGLWWRDVHRARLLHVLLSLPAQVAVLPLWLHPAIRWGGLALWGTLLLNLLAIPLGALPTVQRRFLERLWPEPSDESSTEATWTAPR